MNPLDPITLTPGEAAHMDAIRQLEKLESRLSHQSKVIKRLTEASEKGLTLHNNAGEVNCVCSVCQSHRSALEFAMEGKT